MPIHVILLLKIRALYMPRSAALMSICGQHYRGPANAPPTAGQRVVSGLVIGLWLTVEMPSCGYSIGREKSTAVATERSTSTSLSQHAADNRALCAPQMSQLSWSRPPGRAPAQRQPRCRRPSASRCRTRQPRTTSRLRPSRSNSSRRRLGSRPRRAKKGGSLRCCVGPCCRCPVRSPCVRVSCCASRVSSCV